jgi:hypothetical protein
MATKNPMSFYDAAPSGLTREERIELVALMNKPNWTSTEKSRIKTLKSKMNYSVLG